MSAIDEKLIRDKWVDIVHSQAKGRIVDSTSLAVEIVRWSEARQAERIAALEEQLAREQISLVSCEMAHAALEQAYAESVAEFNAGYEAYQRGEKEQDEPSSTKYDQWRVGYAWAAWLVVQAVPVTEHDAAHAQEETE